MRCAGGSDPSFLRKRSTAASVNYNVFAANVFRAEWPPNAAFGRNQTVLLDGRAAVASASARRTATTERGPPYHPKTFAQNARMFRHKGL